MTFDEAFNAASRLLSQRGQLLNGHLLRLVEGNKDLFREVRERLIEEGLAEDRSGVGLTLSENATEIQRENGSEATFQSVAQPNPQANVTAFSGGENSTSETVPPDWWLMKSGAVRGPMDLVALSEMYKRGEIEPADVVRQGSDGLWRQPGKVPELAASRFDQLKREQPVKGVVRQYGEPWQFSKSSTAMPGSKVRVAGDAGRDEAAGDEHQVSLKETFIPPEKIWSMGNQARPGIIIRGWKLAADIVGGSKRLLGIIFSIVAFVAFMYWWQQPPSNGAIYREFTSCRAALQKLRDRRVGRSEFAPVVERYRPRVERILDRLRPLVYDRYPVEKSLYLAGADGLLRLLEIPADPTDSERVFDAHMKSALENMNR